VCVAGIVRLREEGAATEALSNAAMDFLLVI
jgi:hypothetical protein